MKIAAYINEHEQVAAFPSGAQFRLFSFEGGQWIPERDITLDITTASGLTELTARINTAIRALGDCQVALLGELRGLLRALLEENGLRTWKSAGNLYEQLSAVATCEAELAAQKTAEPSIEPQPVGNPADGHYFLDLVEVLQSETHPASRDVLLPFMQAAPFRQLDIRCDHLPRWFEGSAKALELDFTRSAEDAAGIFTLTVTLDPARSTAPRSMEAYSACARSCSKHGCSGC